MRRKKKAYHEVSSSIPSSPGHVNKINSFIPLAKLEADRKIRESGVRYVHGPGIGGVEYRFCMWTIYFHRAMNRLTSEAGLRIT